MKTTKTGPLLEILYFLYPESSTKKIKNYLKNGCIYVNGKKVTQYDFIVFENSEIEIHKDNKTHRHSLLPILYEDDDFLVIDKPRGLLSIGTEKEKEKTAYHLMRQFVKERGRGEKLFILHRLDKETSGVLVFTKNEKLKHLLQKDWDNLVKERHYVAIVEGKAKEKETLRLYLNEGKDLKMYVTTQEKGRLAITNYQCIKTQNEKSLLSISIETGRKNQIRASLAFVGIPILGDRKYGTGKKSNRLYLHADQLTFLHPITKKKYHFEAKIPREFKTIFKEK